MCGTTFEWRKTEHPDQKGFSVWSTFSETTDYFQPSQKDFMFNFRIEHLEQLLEVLRSEGVTVLDSIETFEYGKFAHIMDLEGNKIELWGPNDPVFDKVVGTARTY